MKEQVRMWVDPAFKRRLKQLANDKDKKLIAFTRELSQDEMMLERIKPKRQRVDYDFGPAF